MTIQMHTRPAHHTPSRPTALRVVPQAPSPPTWLATLTPREREVLLLVAKGLNNTELAEHLFVSMATVKTHIAQLLRKTGSRDRIHLVVRCWAAGLLTPTRPTRTPTQIPAQMPVQIPTVLKEDS